MEDNIITIDYGRGHMRIFADTFFPCSQTQFKKLLKVIEQDWGHSDEIIEYLQKFLPAKLELEKAGHNTKAYLDKLGRNINLLIDYCVKR